MKADAKLVYFFQKNKFCLLQIEKKLLFSRVRDWKVLQKFGSHKGANALSKGPLLRVAGRRVQIWYCAT